MYFEAKFAFPKKRENFHIRWKKVRKKDTIVEENYRVESGFVLFRHRDGIWCIMIKYNVIFYLCLYFLLLFNQTKKNYFFCLRDYRRVRRTGHLYIRRVLFYNNCYNELCLTRCGIDNLKVNMQIRYNWMRNFTWYWFFGSLAVEMGIEIEENDMNIDFCGFDELSISFWYKPSIHCF